VKKLQQPLESGTRIGSYEIKHVLGIGGFGITYKGYDHTLACDVAVKEYLPSDLATRTSDKITIVPQSEEDRAAYHSGLEKFLQEARTLAKFKMPNIVRVNRYLETNGTAYIVMDYEDGEPLSQYLKARRTLSENKIREIMVPLLEGLQVIHEQKVLHRDIKPGNIYIRKTGSPVLLDFGAARQALQNDEQHKTDTVTPGYAPFEQYDSRGLQGPWTDIYGLGATIYQCITGKPPAPAPERMAALNNQQADPVLNLQRITNSLYSMELLDIVDWMLKILSRDRPQCANDILIRLTTTKRKTGAQGDVIDPASLQTATPPIHDHPIPDSEPSVMWTVELLEEAQRNLAKYMGPLAKLLVPQAAYKASSLEEFLQTLANSIQSLSIREKFLKTMNKLAPKLIEGASPENNMSKRTATERSGLSADSEPSLHSWDMTLLYQIENELAVYVGPLAHILVQKAVRRAATTHALIKMLAKNVPNSRDQKQFLGAVSRLH